MCGKVERPVYGSTAAEFVSVGPNDTNPADFFRGALKRRVFAFPSDHPSDPGFLLDALPRSLRPPLGGSGHSQA